MLYVFSIASHLAWDMKERPIQVITCHSGYGGDQHSTYTGCRMLSEERGKQVSAVRFSTVRFMSNISKLSVSLICLLFVS